MSPASSLFAASFLFVCGCADSQRPSTATDYKSLGIYQQREYIESHTPMMPLPPNDAEFPVQINFYGDVDEPRFDPEVHLKLEQPERIHVLPDFITIDPTKVEMPRVIGSGTSRLAFTTSFKVLSDAGVQVIKKIILRERAHANRNHRNVELRGLYYLSPFIRDLMTNEIVLDHLSKMAGEPILPHFLLMDAPSVNFGKSCNSTESDTKCKVVDHWHFDSVSYVGVILVSDLEGMVGGDLEVIRSDDKWEAINALNESESVDSVTVKYGESGNCVFVQGSEILHHVTPVRYAKEDRLSFVMAFQPSNAFQPDKTVLDTWKRFDHNTGSAPYEYFRLKAWKLSHILKSYVEQTPFTRDADSMAEKLEAVTQELQRTIGLLTGTETDTIGFFDENKGKYRL